MNERLLRYLAESYRRDVMGESVKIEIPELTTDLVAQAKAEVTRIDGLRLGANLVNRDFASYQHRKALIALLALAELDKPHAS